jgi:ABC-2 type transport system permease protein
MSLARTLATARRLLMQLRHDPRTIALMIVVPCVLETLLRLIYDRRRPVFDQAGAPLLAIFPLTTVFLVTSIALLRERTSGTLERLLTTPLGRLELLTGYALSFGLLAAAQAGIASALTLGPLGLHVPGPAGLVVVVAIAVALLGMGLGLFASAFAQSEFQVVQFFPLIILPQLLLCGLLVARERSPGAARDLRCAADVLRGRRHAPPQPTGGPVWSARRRHRDRARVRRRRARARRRDASPADGLSVSVGEMRFIYRSRG